MARLSVVLVLAVAVAAINAATILDIAKSLPQFSTLVTAAGQAGIAPLLAAPGFKTVFAPTNEAFAKLGNNTAALLLNAHNQQHLLSALYYHITPGFLTTDTFKNGQQLATLDQSREGAQAVTISGSGSNFAVNGAAISPADVKASNGVIQVINSVLVPENIGLPTKDIVQTAVGVSALSTLVKLVSAAGLVPALSQPNGPYVVFAPTDAAFAAVPASIVNCLLGNKQALIDVLLFHVVSGLVYSEEIAPGATVPTLAQGKPLSFNIVGNTVKVNYGAGFPAADVVIPNVEVSNGVVHVIDKVLFDNTGPCKQA